MSIDVIYMAAQAIHNIIGVAPDTQTVIAHAVSSPDVMYLSQALDLSNVDSGSAPKVNIIFSESQRTFMRNFGIGILFLWFLFFIAKLAIPGKGGAGGNMVQKVGGWTGLIVAGILALGLITPDVMISIINAILWLASFVWGLLSTLWK